MQHQARKRFGQNFLVDEAVIESILRAIRPQADDALIEIGPGQAALTAALLQHLQELVAVELDRDLAAGLRQRWGPERLHLIEADVLQLDFAQLINNWPGTAALAAGQKIRVVGNLPYNISSPLLFHLLPFADLIQDQHFMLQREVVQRMVAAPGSSAYGRLAVMLQVHYSMTHLFDVDPTAFKPIPKVVSALVRMRPLAPDKIRRPRDGKVFAALLARVFGQRRKMLRASLGTWAGLPDWDKLGIAASARPQELSVPQLLDLADSLAAAGAMPARQDN